MSPLIESLGGAHGFGLFAASGSVAPVGAYDALATVTLSSTQSSVTFSGIPSTYTHLQVRAIIRNTRGGATEGLAQTTFNGDTGTNYAWHALWGNGSSASAFSGASQNYIYSIDALDNGNTGNVFSAGVIDILDYANTNKYKTVRTFGGYDANGSGVASLVSGLWTNTAAINSITFNPASGGPWAQYSSFALYGIR